MPKPSLADLRSHLPAVAGFGVPFVLIVYLAMEAGGYDLIVRSQVGIIIWWVVLLGVVAGLLPLTRITRAGWIGFAVVGALVLWTAIATFTWTESTERSMIELSRTLMLFGVFLLFLLLQGRESLRRSVSAVGAAVAVIAVVALASRFQPDWFPTSGIPENFPVSRLNHPLEYWNGLAALLAIGLAPLLWVAGSGKSLVGRALAGGAIPVVVLALYLTASRGGAIEAAAALLVLVILFPKRLLLLPTLIITGLGSGLLLLLVDQRPEVRDRILGDQATSQGNEMLWLTIGVFVLVAIAQYGFGLLTERRKLVIPTMSRQVASRFGIASGVVAVLLILIAIGTGFVGDKWGEFKEPDANQGNVSRLGNLNSGERYKVWDSAVDASGSESLTGIGPGTFEYWWAREGTGVQFVRDAHSLYLEALAEMGPLGFLLVLAMVLVPIGLAGAGAVRRGSDERRALLATSAAGMTAFAVAAGIDWAWEITVLPAIFFILAAGVLGPGAESRRGRRSSRFSVVNLNWKKRSALGLASVVALVIIALPLVGTTLIRQSQEAFRAGDTSEALNKADRAIDIQPYSASAEMQIALIKAQMGDREAAMSAAADAIEHEPTNWKTWFVMGDLSGKFGDEKQAKSSFSKAASLNIRSAIPDLSSTSKP